MKNNTYKVYYHIWQGTKCLSMAYVLIQAISFGDAENIFKKKYASTNAVIDEIKLEK